MMTILVQTGLKKVVTEKSLRI
ncbi:hypothetical protein Godav_009288 [Gossypium davidsonii]|uniref:Uncharacterized protein n=1 Tax=Gossypium davidsonii TaxID=34287 RepID=A0A7J8SDB1_GOSDV|nr:hypothetical protein [Gossypium davidsonii]